MNHSCTRHGLGDVFRDKPVYVRALFDRFRAMVDERGPTTMIVYRDRVGFMVRVRFCGAIPKRDHIELAFWFIKREDNPRFSKIETIATNAHVHRAEIRNLEELDGSVHRWIDVAYRVGCREHLRVPYEPCLSQSSYDWSNPALPLFAMKEMGESALGLSAMLWDRMHWILFFGPTGTSGTNVLDI